MGFSRPGKYFSELFMSKTFLSTTLFFLWTTLVLRETNLCFLSTTLKLITSEFNQSNFWRPLSVGSFPFAIISSF